MEKLINKDQIIEGRMVKYFCEVSKATPTKISKLVPPK